MSYEDQNHQSDRQPQEQPKSQVGWQHPNGRNEKHRKSANGEQLNADIATAQKALADLKTSGGSKKDKAYWKSQIMHYRKMLNDPGIEHSRIGKCQYQQSYR